VEPLRRLYIPAYWGCSTVSGETGIAFVAFRKRLKFSDKRPGSDDAEDFNHGGRGHRLRQKRRVVHPRPVRLKIERAKPRLDLAGQLRYVY
jgi:hypothetical protein